MNGVLRPGALHAALLAVALSPAALAPAALAQSAPAQARHAQPASVHLHSAGSLRAAMTDMAKAYQEAYGVTVETTFGGSGLLKDRLLSGEPGDVFTSADMGNPEALTQAGKSGSTVLFAHNHLCALARPGLKVTPETVLKTLLDPKIKLGTSTPIGDPAGDYAWILFKKADALRPGSRATLEAKAIKIGKAPGSVTVPQGESNGVAWLFREKRADIFLAYCTGGAALAEALPGSSTVQLPASLAIDAAYGLTILKSGNQEQAAQFAMFILSPAGQKILTEHGFDAPLQPKPLN